jgi:hypothetical protein
MTLLIGPGDRQVSRNRGSSESSRARCCIKSVGSFGPDGVWLASVGVLTGGDINGRWVGIVLGLVNARLSVRVVSGEVFCLLV